MSHGGLIFAAYTLAATVSSVAWGKALSLRPQRWQSTSYAVFLSLVASAAAFCMGLLGFNLSALGDRDAETIAMALWTLVGGPTCLLVFPFALWLGRDFTLRDMALSGALLFVAAGGMFGLIAYAHPPDVVLLATMMASFQAAWLVYAATRLWIR